MEVEVYQLQSVTVDASGECKDIGYLLSQNVYNATAAAATGVTVPCQVEAKQNVPSLSTGLKGDRNNLQP